MFGITPQVIFVWVLLLAAPVADLLIVFGKLCNGLKWSWWTLAVPPIIVAAIIVGIMVLLADAIGKDG